MDDKVNSMQKSKVMNILADETGGKSYKAHKYSLDNTDRPSIDYDEEKTIHWEDKAETETYKTYINLTFQAKNVAKQSDQLLSYFLDGSRRVFKVDDIAYANAKNRSTIYPILAGQIGVGCCHRVSREMVPEKFKTYFRKKNETKRPTTPVSARGCGFLFLPKDVVEFSFFRFT